MKTRLFISSIVFISVSCAVQKTVYYDTSTVPANPNKLISKKSICILKFNDIRKDIPGNEIFIQKPKEIIENNKTYCINSEEYYKKTPLSEQMAWMLADHMTKRGTFKSVTVDKKDSADYIIECNLARITGKQHLPDEIRGRIGTSAVIGGVIGAGIGKVSTANIKSKAIVSFAITDVKIYDKNMNLLAELGSFAKDYEEETHPDVKCMCSYDNVRDKLKDFYSEFIIEVENKIIELGK
jgi:hypothetical protein